METKEFTKFEKARIKRTAQNVNQYVGQKNRIKAKIEKLQAELEEVQKLIDMTDASTLALTGYYSEDLVKKVVTTTDKGLKIVKFELIYPDTVVPPIEEKENTEESSSNTETETEE